MFIEIQAAQQGKCLKCITGAEEKIVTSPQVCVWVETVPALTDLLREVLREGWSQKPTLP